MVRRKLYLILLGLTTILFSSGLIYGATSVSVKNYFETGIIDIDLKEYQVVNGVESPWEDNPIILPGDVISKIPRIHNPGNDCYVRAKISFLEIAHLNDTNLVGISDKWFKADDGYYYYTEILPHGEAVDIFEAVSIPHDFPQSISGESFFIDIDVDAIQAANFQPQFNLASPWGSIEILRNEKGDYDVSTFKSSDNQTFKIVYQGTAEKFVKNANDFFVNLPYLMPGDRYSDTVILENDSDEPVKIHFRAAASDKSELLDLIRLEISTKISGKRVIFYSGPLRGANLSKDSVLGTIPANSKAEFTFDIYVPVTVNNQYSISSSSVQWIFSTDITEVPENPKTGDTTKIGLYFGCLGLSLIGFVTAVFLVIHDNKQRKGAKIR